MSIANNAYEASATAYDTVRERIYRDILEGKLRPGDRLTITLLAKRYGTSATPIRVALQELQGQGLVTIQPHQGARVRKIDEDYISNIYELRRAIAGLLIPKSVRMISNADIEQLEALEAKHAAAVAKRDVRAINHFNRCFQSHLFELATNPEASAVMVRSSYLIDALRMMFGYGDTRLKSVVRWHERLLAELKYRNAQKGVEVYMNSSKEAQKDLIQQLKRHKTTAG